MRVIYLSILFGLITIVSLNAQDLKFEVGSYDFGEVKEEDGPVSYTFSFVNTADEAVRITAVNASCGCTTPQWTKELVQPGDSGLITAAYNPLNRPGKFNKSLVVGYNVGESTNTSTLYIEGEVKPKPTTIEDELPTVIGDLRVKYKTFNIGRITTKEEIVKRFDVYNHGDSVVIWSDSVVGPKHVNVRYEPDTLQTQELGAIVLTYNPKEKDDLGFVSDNVVLFASNQEDSDLSFNVIATIQEYFPEMTEEELAKAPRLVFDRTQHDFGKVNVGNTVVTEFEVTNKGQTPLLIRKTKSNCGCTVSKIESESIAPGETKKLEVILDTSGRRGRQYKTVTVFSNDPSAPSQMISIKADIQEE